jgi:hypothetical protein
MKMVAKDERKSLRSITWRPVSFASLSRIRASFNASVNIIIQQHSTPFASKALLVAAMIPMLNLYLVRPIRRDGPIPVCREDQSFVGNTRTESNIKGGKPKTDYI